MVILLHKPYFVKCPLFFRERGQKFQKYVPGVKSIDSSNSVFFYTETDANSIMNNSETTFEANDKMPECEAECNQFKVSVHYIIFFYILFIMGLVIYPYVWLILDRHFAKKMSTIIKRWCDNFKYRIESSVSIKI